jgi:hypothetical protein
MLELEHRRRFFKVPEDVGIVRDSLAIVSKRFIRHRLHRLTPLDLVSLQAAKSAQRFQRGSNHQLEVSFGQHRV